MKKRIAFVLIITLLASCAGLSASATSGNTTEGTTIVTTSIDPTYTVTIPADTYIIFNALSTGIGEVKLASARLDPGKHLHVTAAYESLKNNANTHKTIPYALKSAGATFTDVFFVTAGDKAGLSVDITQTAWDSAFAGDYSDNITFTVSYETIAD